MENTNHPPEHYSNNPTGRPAGRPQENRFVEKLKRPVVFIPLLLLLVLLGVYLYKESQLRDVRRQADQEQAAVVERANQRIADNNRYFLQILTRPFSWALRTALLTGNVEQVDQYLFQFVQEQKFSLLLVADENGKIISSTDQNFTGAAFSDHFNANYLNADDTIVNDENPERVEVITPIMGFNSKVGTLLVVYMPDEPLQHQQAEE